MLAVIKNRVEAELKKLPQNIDKTYHLNRISPLLFSSIKDFILRKGKRIRPIMFTVGYLGFAKKPTAGIYQAALSIELLHDFMLIHDDIIDKSSIRRGKPSMHKVFDTHLKNYKNIKFNGQDLAILAGDVIYALAMETFLAIKENMARKQLALKKFIQAALHTGAGEFIELLTGLKRIEQVSKNDIYKIYDYKTAGYTFSTPLASGAILAGANLKETNRLFKYGIYLGRAFQIKDDILGMFASQAKIGKSTLSDLQEAKKTLLVWHAYNFSKNKDKTTIKQILGKNTVVVSDLLTMRQIILRAGSLEYAEKEIFSLAKKAKKLIQASSISMEYKNFLRDYPDQILKT
ncbi:MAG: polyprenyl synthetase family protein [Candidatus Omnitrophica bacterium]|nr:polyprenyl synthetase family protein [Candidatus Omnitrophota bacterium]